MCVVGSSSLGISECWVAEAERVAGGAGLQVSTCHMVFFQSQMQVGNKNSN